MLDLAIVTSASNGYGAYLDEWATSIVQLNTRPAMVAIAHAASERRQVAAAVTRLTTAGLRVLTQEVDGDPCVGTLRNTAVALTDTEWVQHLDADDIAMPHMLCDVAELADFADVVALGYERTGRLHAGPRNRARTYRSTQGKSTLQSDAPASGVSPFRRSLWERSPYRTDMIGGWDTALWLGFAHMNARFVATKRSCFWYRQHSGSVFNARRRSDRLTAMVGPKLQALRSGASGVSVVVPWASDGGPRDRAWKWLEQRYTAVHPDWQVVRGECAGEWRKGEAVAAALQHATGLTMVLADADCALPAAALTEAVEMVTSGRAPWVVPHTTVRRLDEASTTAILRDRPDTETFGGSLSRTAYTGYAGGGVAVVDRATYEAVGGMPLEFAGWGAEDEALAVILDTLVGPHVRLPYDLWHLWHPPGPRMNDPRYYANKMHLQQLRYLAASPDAMWRHLCNGSWGAAIDAESQATIRRVRAARAVRLAAEQRRARR